MKTAIIALFTVSLFGLNSHAEDPLKGLPPQVVSLHKAMESECDADTAMGSETFALGDKSFLHLVPCFSGAYNVNYMAYTSRENYVRPVMVLAYDPERRVVMPTTNLTNASFEPKTKTLYSYAKGRGIGDCGQGSESRVLGMDSVFTTLIRDKGNCDGKDTAWPVVFRQKLKK